MASKAPKAPKESVTADDNVKLLLTVIKVCDVKLAVSPLTSRHDVPY